jgi:hypothetical protein
MDETVPSSSASCRCVMRPVAVARRQGSCGIDLTRWHEPCGIDLTREKAAGEKPESVKLLLGAPAVSGASRPAVLLACARPGPAKRRALARRGGPALAAVPTTRRGFRRRASRPGA